MVVASDTDLVTVLSSAHGRQRRSERLISKSDLQAAVKYGEKEASYENNSGELRWKYTFREIGRAHVRTPVTEKSRMPSSA